MAEGYVYVLTNAAMPDYVKIGLTSQDDVRVRVRQLDNTSTPLPFEVHFAARVPDCQRLEKTLHFVFGEKRVRASREFFRIDPDLAKAIIELVAIQEETLSDTDQAISPEQRSEIESEKRSRSERLSLDRLGLKPGTILTFSKDPQITCEVVGPRMVRFRGEVTTLSQAALIAIREMGYDWPAARGAEYWTHNGVKLADIAPQSAPIALSPTEQDVQQD